MVLVYCIVASIWVVVSELFLPAPFSLANRLTFVVVTGAVMALLLWRERTEIRQYAAQLRESDVIAGVYFESSAQGILVAAADGRILRTNPTLEQMFSYGHGELEGRPVEILAPDRLRARHTAHRESYLKTPRSRPMGIGLDLAGRRKDGSEFPLEISLNYVAPEAGHPLVVCFITDISERLAFERQTRRAETLNTLGAIAAGIAHDLNNPLAIISSRSELMLSLLDSENPDLRQDLEVLRRNAERASHIANGLLTLAAQRSTARQPVNINELVEATILLIGGELRECKIEVITSLDRNLPQVLGDPSALQRVLMNLVMNARDAMPEGGKVCIASVPAPDQAGMLQLSVADTGAGIPAEVIPKLFDIFFTTKPSGTGLGLWLANRTLREHGGKIEVESELGKGTKFILTLPMMRDEGGSAAEPSQDRR
ncbi:MAG: ATP-binding protein [Candidatus Sulfotelmatobacter sp.]